MLGFADEMRPALAAVALMLVLGPVAVAAQQPVTVFKGRPVFKISEAGVDRVPAAVPREAAVNLECVVSQIGGSYYWASRENKPLVRIDAPNFITYMAVDGSGYIRVVKPDRKALASLLDEAAEAYDYVEHLLLGLRSVTYYGASR